MLCSWGLEWPGRGCGGGPDNVLGRSKDWTALCWLLQLSPRVTEAWNANTFLSRAPPRDLEAAWGVAML